MSITYFLIGIFLGMLPDTIYFTLFILYSKDLKEKRIKLFIGMSLIYILCIMISQYNLILYILFYVFVYAFLKFLYKNKVQIIDIFLILIASLFLSFISFLCFCLVKEDFSNYYFCCVLSKILIFIPFLFKNKFNKIYKNYCKLWNRNDNIKRPIKSITLRNISLIILNCFVLISNFVFIYITNIVR